MEGLKIGHYTNTELGTGTTVFLLENSAIGAYLICGCAPASHELAVLDPENSVPKMHALVFTGGSAYGLYVAKGVMTYLAERGIGHPTNQGVVPIVPTAAIYDLNYKHPHHPEPEAAYEACKRASEDNTDSGRIGVGTGATVGKIIPGAKHMTGGLGRAELSLDDGISVLAYVAVNAIGDVRSDANRIIAGAVDAQGQFADCERYLLSGQAEHDHFKQGNSTLAVVFINVKFSKAELKRIAKMAISGIARSVSPVFTRYDGDIMFCVATGTKDASVSEITIGALAAEAVRQAIKDAVKDSEVIA